MDTSPRSGVAVSGSTYARAVALYTGARALIFAKSSVIPVPRVLRCWLIFERAYD
jgi:hypothetical protein